MKENNKISKEIRSWVLSILGAFFISMLFNSKVLAVSRVQQNSMQNTLFNNQELIVDKFSYNFEKPERGDIIIFLEDEKRGNIIDDTLRNIDTLISKIDNNDGNKSTRLVKRVIGVEGDEIDIKDGCVYVNGEKLEEPYVKGQTISQKFKLPVKVGKDKLFVLGDNREVSRDSRMFGLIDCNQVEGKAVYRIYPFDKIGKIK